MPDLPPVFAPAKLTLYILAASYLVSAALLGVAKSRGEPVPAWVIGTWLVTGLVAVALTPLLAPGRPAVWVGLLVALGPWMAWSLVGDLRGGHWVIAVVDVLGLGAIGWCLAVTAKTAFGPA